MIGAWGVPCPLYSFMITAWSWTVYLMQGIENAHVLSLGSQRLGIYPKELIRDTNGDLYTRLFITGLFI